MSCVPRYLMILHVGFALTYFVSVAHSADPELVTVSLRAIHASRSSDDLSSKTFLSGSSRDKEVMNDIRGKLKKLRYNNYNLVSAQRKSVPINQRDTFTFGDGHTITFKTISRKRDKVCLWLNWKDGKGMNIIDTQLHFVGDETFVTGADAAQDTGLIVAIDVH